MPDDDSPTTLAKVVALLLVSTWALVTISLALEGIKAVQPPFYGVFTALTFLLIGKIWDIEVQKLLSRGQN